MAQEILPGQPSLRTFHGFPGLNSIVLPKFRDLSSAVHDSIQHVEYIWAIAGSQEASVEYENESYSTFI